jgi:hypothetical protein
MMRTIARTGIESHRSTEADIEKEVKKESSSASDMDYEMLGTHVCKNIAETHAPI